MKRIILILLLGLLINPLANADILVKDTTSVELRSFDNEKIEDYRNKSAFNYDRKESILKRWWRSFWKWLLDKLYKDTSRFKDAPGAEGLDTLFAVIFIVIAVVLIVIGLTKVKFRSWITGGSARVKSDYEVMEENIHEIEFDREIFQAEQEGDYRRAIRLQFLKVLKHLSDQEHITWDPNKTNQEYKYEITNSNVYTRFVRAVDIFDWVWYGEIHVGRVYYDNHKVYFTEISGSNTKMGQSV